MIEFGNKPPARRLLRGKDTPKLCSCQCADPLRRGPGRGRTDPAQHPQCKAQCPPARHRMPCTGARLPRSAREGAKEVATGGQVLPLWVYTQPPPQPNGRVRRDCKGRKRPVIGHVRVVPPLWDVVCPTAQDQATPKRCGDSLTCSLTSRS